MQQESSYNGNSAQESDRVRARTAENLNREIDHQTYGCLESLAAGDTERIGPHIAELDREWDMERYLQTNASILALGGVVLGAAVNRKFLLLPGIVFSFLFQHAVQGWCPPVPVFRRLGVRTRKEINRERYALKALRGDFQDVEVTSREEEVAQTWSTVADENLSRQ